MGVVAVKAGFGPGVVGALWGVSARLGTPGHQQCCTVAIWAGCVMAVRGCLIYCLERMPEAREMV
jgi:hypothetical protein